MPPGATARIAQLIAELAPMPNAVSLLVENDDAGEQAARERLLDMPLAHLAGARRGATRAMLKRMVDLTLSIAAVVALAPLLLTVAIAIRLDSPGPVLFKQRRHGYLNEEVLVWKFRSMRTEASDYSASRQVTAGDDRVTRVGRFIRKTSLDELPQLWNVIRGEMSLVGPRPHAIGMLSGGSEASKLVETYAASPPHEARPHRLGGGERLAWPGGHPPRPCGGGCRWTWNMSSASRSGWISPSWRAPCPASWATPGPYAEDGGVEIPDSKKGSCLRGFPFRPG